VALGCVAAGRLKGGRGQDWPPHVGKRGTLEFAPISLKEYAKKHVKSNPGDKESQVIAQLERALKDYQAGVRCSCGEPIWVIGSSQTGNMCFTCITGEAVPDCDYEIEQACDKVNAPGSRKSRSSQSYRS
jgi:hypothetical protein